MRVFSFVFSIILLTASGGTWSPAGATDARGAIKLCDKNPNCSYHVRENGSVTLSVANEQGNQQINCPQKGECSCDVCDHPQRKGPKKGLKANVASTLTGGVAGNPSGGTSARQTTTWNNSELNGVFDRNDIATACAKAGGKSWSNLDSYGCKKENCDGKGQGDAHTCQVSCQEKTKKCKGQTPARLAGGKTLRQVLGVKVSGVASPTRDPNPPRKPPVMTGGNILDGGSGFGTQGPASTGAPLSPGRGSAPPPGQIK
jgi:hypothetical protein